MSFQCKTPVDFLFNFGCVHVQFEISCGVEFTIFFHRSLFVYCELNKLVQAIVFGYVTPDVQVSDSIFFLLVYGFLHVYMYMLSLPLLRLTIILLEKKSQNMLYSP